MSSRRGGSKGQASRSSLAQRPRAVATDLDRLRKNEVEYKAKIKMLEVEVSTLKDRLDGLRKAKNTIVHREREVPSPPNMVRLPHPPQQSCHSDSNLLQQQVDSLNSRLLSERSRYEQVAEEAAASHKREVIILKKRHADELQELTATLTKRQVDKDREDLHSEIKQLRAENSDLSQRCEEVLVANEALRSGSALLQEKSEALLEELSIKEAEWSQREDRLTAEIRKQWGTRYQEWITKAEKKMEELQQVNTLLQSMLKTKQKHDL